jgi:hypothetical protein
MNAVESNKNAILVATEEVSIDGGSNGEERQERERED